VSTAFCQLLAFTVDLFDTDQQSQQGICWLNFRLNLLLFIAVLFVACCLLVPFAIAASLRYRLSWLLHNVFTMVSTVIIQWEKKAKKPCACLLCTSRSVLVWDTLGTMHVRLGQY